MNQSLVEAIVSTKLRQPSIDLHRLEWGQQLDGLDGGHRALKLLRG